MSEYRENSAQRIAIIGGGIAGISTAVSLVELTQALPTARRPRIELFEARRTFGGRAGSFVDSETAESLDLCQHVSMGCCTEFARFIETIGASDDFRRDRELFFLANKSDGTLGRVNRMRATPLLPAPVHLSWSLFRLDYLGWHEERKVEQALLGLLMQKSTDDGKTTIAQFLNARKVPPRAQELFFKPVIVSALSVSMEQASLAAARKVFVDAFMKSRRGYELLVPRRPISEILESRAIPWLAKHGVEVHRAAPVKRIVFDAQNQVTGVELASGDVHSASHVVATVPWMGVGELFDPAIRAAVPELEKISHLETAPIVSVHLWFDRAIMEMPHLVLPGRVSQWLFAGAIENGKYHYQIVISAAYAESKMLRDELTQIILRELQDVLPIVHTASLLRSQVIMQSRAVFAPTPGHEQFRPASKASTIAGFYFAGDWTATGWPATMESAMRSGSNAAQSIVANLK
jgi:squalene-associated FAD-dependent desaturase